MLILLFILHFNLCEALVVMAKQMKSQIDEKPYFWRTQWHHPLRPDTLDAQAGKLINKYN